ncbi:MAG: TonB-dependent receptor [Kofleriaceae bacterium]
MKLAFATRVLVAIPAMMAAHSIAHAQQAQAVLVRGVLIDRATNEPVAGAIISVAGELLASDDSGAFEITLAPGTYTFGISAPFLVSTEQRVVVTTATELRFEVDAADEASGERIEIVDIAPTAPGETRVDAKLARSVPGGGDAGKVVQSLPAVARPPTGSSEIVVWGAAPRDTRVFVDGVPVPALYHVGGYRAAVGNDLVGDIRLTPAAFGPARGRAIGGVIDIGTDDPANVPRIRAQLDPLDASLAGRATLGPIAIAAAARYSLLDRAIDAIADPRELAPNAPLPRWADAQIVARGALTERTTLSGWVIGSLDTLERTLASDDPATEVREDVTQRWLRAQLTVRRDTARGVDSATLWFGRDTARDAFAFGMLPASHDSHAWVGGARAQQEVRLLEPALLFAPEVPGEARAPRPIAITLAYGADVDAELATLSRSGSLSIPAREGDPHIFGQPPGDDVSSDRWSSTTLDIAGHAALDVRVGRLSATVGGRVDAWMLDASRLTPRVGATPGIGTQTITYSHDPRGTVQYKVTDAALLRVDAGRYHQARAASDASAVFGTSPLGLEQAWHLTAGGQYRASPFAIEAAAYARWLDDLVARDLAVTPPLAATLTQAGTGRVLGVQLTARLVGYRGLTGWLSYTLSRSTRRDAPGADDRLFDHDQTHGLVAIASFERGPWTLGGRVRFASGEPRTGVVGSFFDTRSGRFQPIRGPHNGERLPAYFAADLRAERRFVLAGTTAADTHSTRAAVYLELQNLTNRANAEEIIYNADYSQKSYLTSLPFLAIAGLRIER